MFRPITSTVRNLTIAGALALGVSVPAQAGEIVLDEQQLDGVVAGLSLNIFANALAFGNRTYTNTDTYTNVVDNYHVTIGYGKGKATAAAQGSSPSAYTEVGAVIKDADVIEIKYGQGTKTGGSGSNKYIKSESTIEVRAIEYKHTPFSFKTFLAIWGKR